MSEKQLNSALKHLLRDEYSQAEDLLKKIVSSQPGDYKAFYLLGWINEKIHKPNDAQNFYNRAYYINPHFFDIDEKIFGYEKFYENQNEQLKNVIIWMTHSEKTENIDRIIAKANKSMVQSLLDNEITVKSAKLSLYNAEISKLIKPYAGELTMLIIEIGMTLNLWGMIHPWNFPVAFNYLNELSKAILDEENYKTKLLAKSHYSLIELEIIKKWGYQPALPVLLKMLHSKKDSCESVIYALGILKDIEGIFPLLNHLKNCPFDEIYPAALALCRIGEPYILPVMKKYLKKFMNTELAPLLHVCLCRLERGKEALMELCQSPDMIIKEEAINQIGDYRGKDVVKILLNALFDKTKVSDYYPIRAAAYEKLDTIGMNYLKHLDESFSYSDNINELKKIFTCDNPQILWVEKLLENW